MEQTEGMQLVSSRTKGHISSQVVEIRGAKKKNMPEQELSITSSVKKMCFACHDTSHNLERCGIKYKHTTVAHQFGYATKYPFTMIHPSEETVESEKFYHHCVLITSNLSNLDQGILKSKLVKFWKLSGDWELRRDCNKSFLASFSSEDDVRSCLKHPKMKILLDDKEVNFTVTRWNESDNEDSLDLIEEWFLVRGVRRIYRNWKDLYQVASAFGVLIDVDEESLKAGDKEPIRLKIALRCLDGAPFSYYFALGQASSLVMLTVVQDKAEGMQQQNMVSDKEHIKELNAAQNLLLGEPKCIEESRMAGEIKGNKISAPAISIANTKKTTMDSSKPEEVQPVGRSSTNMIGEEHFEGKPKPRTKYVFRGRGKQQQVTETEVIHIYGSFSDMGLDENLLKGIYQYGLEKPSVVHQRGIVPFCNGQSVIHESLSGTTVTLCTGVLQRLDYESAECQALIIVPTRDLMYETEKVIEALGQFLGVKAYTCTGGTSFRVNQQTLSSRVQVVIGTPGRILDLLARDALCKDHIRMLVLDEADELLTGGFKDQTCNIIQYLPAKIQVGLFSAAFSSEALETSHWFMEKHMTITVPRDKELKDIGIKQFYHKVEKEEKPGELYALFDTLDSTRIVIFVNSKQGVKTLAQDVSGKGYTVSASHGGMSQLARDTAIQEFRAGSSHILIATDLRGTNLGHVPIVINYDLPTQLMQYIGRVQQQRRYSEPESVAINFVTPADERIVFDIQRFCSGLMSKLPSNPTFELLVGYDVQKCS